MAKKFNNIFNLENKTALVIGGSGYLGFEMSNALFLMGAKVIIASKDIKNFNYNFLLGFFLIIFNVESLDPPSIKICSIFL